jgi:hypothetical protein
VSDYVLQVGRRRLRLGTSSEPAQTSPVTSAVGASWDLPRQALTARQIVESLDTLFEAVCLRLGPEVDREPLLQSMAATLAIAGREACLPLAILAFADPVRRELTSQAARIGRTLAAWAAEANRARVALDLVGREKLGTLELRSRCDGHLWTEKATSILTGGRGGPVVMQLYNEWLHQMVLLRDALLPFENWEQVPLPLALHGGFRGLRGLEPARDRFLAEFLTRILPHASVVDFARSLFEPTGTRGTARDGALYGFQAESGLVLPAVVGRDDVYSAPGGLLTWHPARIASPPTGRTLAFRYAFADYLSAPRSLIGPPSDDVPLRDEAAIVAEPADEDGVRLRLELTTGQRSYRVDLGQCLRGQRFAYRPVADAAVAAAASDVVSHDIGAVLGQAGLVTAHDGIHLLPTDGDAVLTLALLGKIYPENTVLAGIANWSNILRAGKGYGAKFVVGLPQSVPDRPILREARYAGADTRRADRSLSPSATTSKAAVTAKATEAIQRAP